MMMNHELLDFVSDIGKAQSADAAGRAFIKFSQNAGANVVHAFMGTEIEYFRVTTMPDWAIEVDCSFPDLLKAHSVVAVRSGQPRVFWGEDFDCDNQAINETSRNIAHNRRVHFGSRTNVTFAMPDTDGRYRGGGVGLGFEDGAPTFLDHMSESCGALAVASFAVHSRMQVFNGHARTTSPLSKRQAEVLQLLAAGYHLGAISDRLGIVDSTVNLHLAQLKKKLNVKTKEQALAMALSNGWIAP